MRPDATLEEMWRIKREIASEYATLEDYFKGMLAFQDEERKRGVKFVSFAPVPIDSNAEVSDLFVAEDGVEYDPGKS